MNYKEQFKGLIPLYLIVNINYLFSSQNHVRRLMGSTIILVIDITALYFFNKFYFLYTYVFFIFRMRSVLARRIVGVYVPKRTTFGIGGGQWSVVDQLDGVDQGTF